jgi:hypothetical protein
MIEIARRVEYGLRTTQDRPEARQSSGHPLREVLMFKPDHALD